VDVGRSVGDTEHFGFVWGTEHVGRALLNVEYVARGKLDDLSKLGLVLDMEFPLDDVRNGWASVVYGDGLADMKFSDTGH